MGVDSKMFVKCNKSDVSKVGQLVIQSLKDFVGNKLEQQYGGKGWVAQCKAREDGINYKSPTISSYDFETYTIPFAFQNEQRSLWMHTTCECDVSEYLQDGEYAVIFSLGCWRSNVDIISHLATDLSVHYEVWVDMNDSDDVEYEEWK